MKCQYCNDSIETDDKHLNCDECSNDYHFNCLGKLLVPGSSKKYVITEDDYNFIVSTGAPWKCPLCNKKKSKDDSTPITPVSQKTFNLQLQEKVTDSQSSAKDSDSDVSEFGAKKKVSCQICKKGFSHNAYRAECCICSCQFHFKCVNISKETYFAKNTNWECDNCSKKSQVQDIAKSVSKMSSDSVNMRDILCEMKLFRQEAQSQNKEITDSLNKYGDWLVENTEKIKEIGKQLNDLVTGFDLLKQENCDLKKKNAILTSRLNQVEQAMKDNVIEIQGVPLRSNESVLNILSNISKAIGFKYEENMVDNCYRFKSPSGAGSRLPGIVVRFVRRLDKEAFVQARRVKRNLNSRDIGFMEGEASVIYVNDSLTPERRKLLNAARDVKREKQFTFLWVKNGRIYMRKNEGDRVIVIHDYDDISKLQ